MCEEIEELYNEYEVVGAGKLRISKENTAQCGGKVGFSFGVEWGQHGFAGGVISNEEAVRLAKHILRVNNLSQLLDE
jgi:hypothetical protein